MAHLIIGHTTHHSAHLWVREDKHREVHISIRSVPRNADEPPHVVEGTVVVDRQADYTGTVVFDGLRAGTEYQVRTARGDAVAGRFRTMADPAHEDALPFSFVLSSCNMPVVSVSNLLSFLLVMGGAEAARSSFDLSPDRWKLPSWLAPPLRIFGKIGLKVAGFVIAGGTGAKQAPPPYLRSPFLKLSAVFDSWLIDLAEAPADAFPMVGDIVTAGSARGTVASLTKTKKPKIKPERATCQLVVTHVEGRFTLGHTMVVQGRESPTPIGILRVDEALPWFEEPSFFVHAGDQIYYDFPSPDREPAQKEYRRSYREAWFDDPCAHHILSHWPHYMTLDDHEIADQYAADFSSPAKEANGDPLDPARYLSEAMGPYEEYVAARNPQARGGAAPSKGNAPYWYTFRNGKARFFVLDARTQRRNWDKTQEGVVIERSQMIDESQMIALLDWMVEKPSDDLKFVVTSVPFVAEFDEEAVKEDSRWHDQTRPGDRPNAENDKWSAPQFRSQRRRIIEHIHRENVEQLVFLTGDMHCCYHAMMRVGRGSKYECVTVHELAGGPLNQLQLPNLAEFRTQYKGRTSEVPSDTSIDYEVTLERFHSQVSAVMHLKVDYAKQKRRPDGPIPIRPRLEWNVIRTLTDVGASGWSPQVGGSSTPCPGESPLSGRIDFVTKREFRQLPRW